ncbi:chorismate synthase [Sphaerochaeta sp. PS]|uniref:chorismate synthase n=1 Tax=Sphaerochaeta sp. PS TaxID=3076336 RepID=UPI0028A49E31|nr:chorismate synthase [Sphaerochaeta sp. PS]MDT4762861.1 chorismate synthase [Sphaerochaeta sp. PS]
MGHNSFGSSFTVTTFGESHGQGLGVIIDGIQSGFCLDIEQLQREMSRRRPGANPLGTERNEQDELVILSGMYEGLTTGTPLAMILYNTNQRSYDYSNLKDVFRPGHADWTFFKKYGVRDIRGGGRSSGRETSARVAAGGVAKQILAQKGIAIFGGTVQVGPVVATKRNWEECDNALTCPDKEAAIRMAALIDQVRSEKDSIGGIIECRVTGLPAGLGEPVFGKLQALLSHAVMSIGAIKGVQFGDGFACATMRGSQFNDQRTSDGFLSNHSGGILGGISSGQEVILQAAVRPTASIGKSQQTVDKQNKTTDLLIEGRHDPCICPRAVVVVEAMVAITLLDLWYTAFGKQK